jgi:hypothetical protein
MGRPVSALSAGSAPQERPIGASRPGLDQGPGECAIARLTVQLHSCPAAGRRTLCGLRWDVFTFQPVTFNLPTRNLHPALPCSPAPLLPSPPCSPAPLLPRSPVPPRPGVDFDPHHNVIARRAAPWQSFHRRGFALKEIAIVTTTSGQASPFGVFPNNGSGERRAPAPCSPDPLLPCPPAPLPHTASLELQPETQSPKQE